MFFSHRHGKLNRPIFFTRLINRHFLLFQNFFPTKIIFTKRSNFTTENPFRSFFFPQFIYIFVGIIYLIKLEIDPENFWIKITHTCSSKKYSKPRNNLLVPGKGKQIFINDLFVCKCILRRSDAKKPIFKKVRIMCIFWDLVTIKTKF